MNVVTQQEEERFERRIGTGCVVLFALAIAAILTALVVT